MCDNCLQHTNLELLKEGLRIKVLLKEIYEFFICTSICKRIILKLSIIMIAPYLLKTYFLKDCP